MKVRKLQESDWGFLPSWWESYNQPIPQRNFLPDNGLGGFIVETKGMPIAAMFLWTTNSDTAIPAVVISDASYRDTNRSDALQLLVDFTTDFAHQMGYKFSFAWAKPGKMLEYYKKSGWTVDDTPSYELIIQY